MKKRAIRKVATRRPTSRKKAVVRAMKHKPTRSKSTRKKSRNAPTAQPARLMHTAVVTGLKKWVSTLEEPAQNRPLVAAATGGSSRVVITPRTLINHVEKRTAIGKRYFENIQRLAVAQVVKNFGGGGGSRGGSGGGVV
jgi:hypothetical protein